MYFIVFLLVFLAVIFGIIGLRSHKGEYAFMAWCFLLAAFGTGMISLFAYQAIHL